MSTEFCECCGELLEELLGACGCLCWWKSLDGVLDCCVPRSVIHGLAGIGDSRYWREWISVGMELHVLFLLISFVSMKVRGRGGESGETFVIVADLGRDKVGTMGALAR